MLGTRHLPDIIELLVEFSHKWRCIGTALRFTPQDLDKIQACPTLVMNAPESYMTRVVEDWIQGKCKHTLPPKISTLERVLNSRTVGLGKLADKLQAYVEDLPANSPIENSVQCYVCFSLQVSLSSTQIVEVKSTSNLRRDLAVEEDRAVLFEVKVSSDIGCKVSPTYQWIVNGQNLRDCKEFFGSNSPILCLTKADIGMDGFMFTCKLTLNESHNAIETKSIMLRVDCMLDDYSSSLALLYSLKPEVPEDTWPPVSNTKYINLALIKQEQVVSGSEYAYFTIRGDIDDIIQHKDKIEFDDIVRGLTVGQVLFIEGRPGSGKTTFVNKITQKWATSNVKLGVRLVLLVSLRVLNNLKVSKPNLSDILNLFQDLKIGKQHIEERNGKGVCFIFDGLDEFSPKDGKTSIVFKIISKSYLSQSTVIVASCPSALAKLRSKASKVIEVLGFLKDQIFEYFDHYPFSDCMQVEHLKRHLFSHLNILHMCYLPIHAAMVAYLYQVTGEIPQTETDIYTHFTMSTVKRSVSKTADIDLEDDHQFYDECESYLKQICKLALEKTVLNKQVLHQDEVKPYFRAPKFDEDTSLGLITIDRTAGLYGFKDVYTFLHLTFQEYLAACFINTLSNQEQVAKHGAKPHMLVVWKFFCGLQRSKLGCKFLSICEKTEGRSLFHFQCVYESQYQETCNQLLKSTNGNMEITGKYLTTPDFSAIGFVTAKPIITPVKFTLSHCNINIEPINQVHYPNIEKISLVELEMEPPSLNNVLSESPTAGPNQHFKDSR